MRWYHRKFDNDYFLPEGVEQEFDNLFELLENSICSIYQDGWVDSRTDEYLKKFNDFNEYIVDCEKPTLIHQLRGIVFDIINRPRKKIYYKAVILNRFSLLKIRLDRVLSN